MAVGTEDGEYQRLGIVYSVQGLGVGVLIETAVVVLRR